MVEKNECVTPKCELEVPCMNCKKNVTLENSGDIVRLMAIEYPYGGIMGFVFNQLIIPTYYFKCPHCSHLQHIKRRLIPRKIRKDIQTLTMYYWQPQKGSCSCEQGPFGFSLLYMFLYQLILQYIFFY